MSSEPRTSIVNGRPVSIDDVAPRLGRAIRNFQAVAYPGRVDLVTRELVRIYSGRKSECRICRNLRLRAAIERGLDESMLDHLDDPTSDQVTPAQRAALRLAHDFLDEPGAFDRAARADLLLHFTPEQAAELLLDLVRYRPGSKLMVVSGMEPADDALVYQ